MEFDLNLDEMFTDESELNGQEAQENAQSTEERQENNNSAAEESTEQKEEKQEKVAEVNESELFSGPEGVGSEEGSSTEDTSQEGGDGSKNSSPKENFYSTIASSFKADGVFQDLSDEELATITDADTFAEVIKKQINSQLDDTQKRIAEALENKVDTSEIQQFESTISYLDGIEETQVSDETDAGETLRKQLIFQDYLNRGFNQEKAKKEMEKSFTAGTDLEDAKDALEGNKDFFKGAYDKLIATAKEERAAEKEQYKTQAVSLEKLILETETPFKDFKIEESVRKKALNNISKIVEKDSNGNQINAIQKLAKDSPLEFQHKLSLLYTLTDGFTNLDGMVKGEVQKRSNKKIKELEHTLNSTRLQSNGTLDFVGDTEDKNSYQGLQLDI